jgi:GAF domain-containing protein
VRGAGDPVAGPGLVATLLGLMRDSLSAGSDRAAVDAMLRRLARVLGDVVLVVGREDAGTLELVGVSVEDGTRFGTDVTSVPSDLGVASQALRGAPVVVADAAAEPAWFDLTGRGRCGVYLPMRLPDRVWGVFAVEWTTVGPAGRADLTALQALADAMAALLESMRVREEAERRAGLESRLRRDRDAQAAVITAGLQAADTETALVRMVRETRHQLGWEALALLTVHPDGTMQVVAQQGYPPTAQDRTFRVTGGSSAWSRPPAGGTSPRTSPATRTTTRCTPEPARRCVPRCGSQGRSGRSSTRSRPSPAASVRTTSRCSAASRTRWRSCSTRRSC